MRPKFGIVVFPGSNCDHDAYYVVRKILGFEAAFLWHKHKDLQNCDVVILPGGFSYGDYLRTGAIARFAPMIESVIEFAEKGGAVLGICNGFQILTEAGLLPGVLLQNESLKFVCKNVFLKLENRDTIFSNDYPVNAVIKIPVAHGDGNYYADEDTLTQLKNENRILFRYSSPKGDFYPEFNPNGSIDNIAGIINKRGNVLGLMPHPERASDPILRNTDGIGIFTSLAKSFLE